MTDPTSLHQQAIAILMDVLHVADAEQMRRALRNRDLDYAYNGKGRPVISLLNNPAFYDAEAIADVMPFLPYPLRFYFRAMQYVTDESMTDERKLNAMLAWHNFKASGFQELWEEDDESLLLDGCYLSRIGYKLSFSHRVQTWKPAELKPREYIVSRSIPAGWLATQEMHRAVGLWYDPAAADDAPTEEE